MMVVGLTTAALAAFIAYEFVKRAQDGHQTNGDVRFVQATLALLHYKSYERIEALLNGKCFDDARTVAREMKKSQMVLLSENLRATGHDQELLDYVKLRDPQLLKDVLAGHLPELKPYETSCVGPGCDCAQ
jgi:hypothetical protein